MKVLITSRRGLGQVERRHELTQLKSSEAVDLFRRVARDKGLKSLASMEQSVLEKYVNKVSCYPLAIKWVIGQVAIGKDINVVIDAINETTSDISKFSFEQVFRSLSPLARHTLCALSVFDAPPSAGVLSYVVDAAKDKFEDALRELILVSLVVPEQYKNEQQEIGNRYTLLSLTRGYVRQQLDNEPQLKVAIITRLESVQATIEEATRAQKQYQFSLANLGATTEEEQVAAMLAQTAFQKYQAGRYAEAVKDYQRAVQIAPRFGSLYRNWAAMEASEQHVVEAEYLLKKASELNPEDIQLWLTWGNINRKQGKIKDALEKYQQAYKLSPNDAIVLNALGQARSRNGDYSEADDLFQRAIALSSNSAAQNEIVNRTSMAKNLMRWAEETRRNYRLAKQKLNAALEHVQAALALNSDDVKTQELHRRLLIDMGFLEQRQDSEQAIRYFLRAIVNKPPKYMKHREAKDTLTASIQAAKLLIEIGQEEEAKRVFPARIADSFPMVLQDARLRESVKNLWTSLYGSDSSLLNGTIKWFDFTKGYGFILNEEGKDIFFHVSSIQEKVEESDMSQGRLVKYKIGKSDGDTRMKAVSVWLVRTKQP